MDICISRKVYLIQISSPFGTVSSLIKKKKVYLVVLTSCVPFIQCEAYLQNC